MAECKQLCFEIPGFMLGDNFSSRDLGRLWKQRGQILADIIRSPLV